MTLLIRDTLTLKCLDLLLIAHWHGLHSKEFNILIIISDYSYKSKFCIELSKSVFDK